MWSVKFMYLPTDSQCFDVRSSLLLARDREPYSILLLLFFGKGYVRVLGVGQAKLFAAKSGASVKHQGSPSMELPASNKACMSFSPRKTNELYLGQEYHSSASELETNETKEPMFPEIRKWERRWEKWVARSAAKSKEEKMRRCVFCWLLRLHSLKPNYFLFLKYNARCSLFFPPWQAEISAPSNSAQREHSLIAPFYPSTCPSAAQERPHLTSSRMPLETEVNETWECSAPPLHIMIISPWLNLKPQFSKISLFRKALKGLLKSHWSLMI